MYETPNYIFSCSVYSIIKGTLTYLLT